MLMLLGLMLGWCGNLGPMSAAAAPLRLLLAFDELGDAADRSAGLMRVAGKRLYDAYVESGAGLDGFVPSEVPDTLREMVE